jgi:lysophospholipid acyltransferase (LPLAT)-like uncharacterized protein
VRIHPAGAGPAPGEAPVIFACLHRDIIPAILYVQPWRPALLISDSPDGEILIRTLARGGYRFVRGSTGKEGSRAFVRLLAHLREGVSVGLAVDGPRGPYGTIRDGVIQLSRRSGCPIVPLVARPGRHRVLGTWDRTVLPWPFSSVRMVSGAPLQVTREAVGARGAAWRTRLARFLLSELAEDSGAPAGQAWPPSAEAQAAQGEQWWDVARNRDGEHS